MDTVNSNILIVWMPSDQIGDERAYRDYILESLRTGVLVLPSEVSCEVMELPPLDGVVVEPPEAPPAPEPEDGDTPASQATMGCDAEMKRVIVQRLKAYRSTHGRGCLDKVSEKTAHRREARLSADTLRDIAADRAPKMELSEWRKIAKALDVLESQV